MINENEAEAKLIIENWKKGQRVELCRIHDFVLNAMESLLRKDSSLEGHQLRKDVEYAWYEKYGTTGGYSGEE